MYVTISICFCTIYFTCFASGLIKNTKRATFQCPDTSCMEFHSINEQIRCCSCNTEPVWRDVGQLKVKEVNGTETAYICEPSEFHSNYSVHYQNGNLKKIPNNICTYPTIVKINFSFNRIFAIGNLTCLNTLDTLILKGNEIRFLSHVTFISMKYIRIIDLSYNKLKYIEPGFLFNMNGNLFHFDVSHNILNTIDITNVLWTKQAYFCIVDYSYNKISSVKNELDWICDKHTDFGFGGMVDLSDNALTTFLNLTALGFHNIFYLGKLLEYNYGFDFRWNPLKCDCHLYPFAAEAIFVIKNYHQDYFDVRCFSPPELKGTDVVELLQKEKLDLLICNISMAEKCPPRCHCYYQPNKKRTVINCNDSERRKMPPALPDFDNLHINLSRNFISDIASGCSEEINDSCLRYFSKIVKLDISYNKIKQLSDHSISLLTNISWIDLKGNEITNVPRSMQAIPTCRVSLGHIVKICTCNDIWLQDWLPRDNRSCSDNSHVMCKIKGRVISIFHMTRESLGCPLQTNDFSRTAIYFGLSCFVFVFCLSLLFSVRFQIFVLLRSTVKRIRIVNAMAEIDYDIYISCNENDHTLRKWILDSLLPFLEAKRFRVFLPFRDSTLGAVREEETIEIMSKSLNYLIILSEKYPKNLKAWIQNEWKYAWYNYTNDLNREIVILNYDMVDCSEISKKHLGAFLRLGKYVDFSNLNQLIKEDIVSLLQKIKPRKRRRYKMGEMETCEERIPLLKNVQK